MATRPQIALNPSTERPASGFNGYLMLLLLVVAVGVTIFGISRLVRDEFGLATLVAVFGGILLTVLIAAGFYMLQPNQGAAITLFGRPSTRSDRTSSSRGVSGSPVTASSPDVMTSSGDGAAKR